MSSSSSVRRLACKKSAWMLREDTDRARRGSGCCAVLKLGLTRLGCRGLQRQHELLLLRQALGLQQRRGVDTSRLMRKLA